MQIFAINTAEKIETIVLSYLKSQTTSGAFGEITSIDNDWLSIRADGVFVRVLRGPRRWQVEVPAKNFVGCDADLLTAAQMALEA